MRALLINHYAGSNRHGMEFRPFYLAREWVKSGHQVTIVAASSSHLRSQEPDVRGHVGQEEIEGVRYIWLKTPRYSGNGVGRASNIMSFVAQLLRYKGWIERTCNPDVVIASSTYPLDTIPACRIARRCDAKLVFEVHDLWPLSPVELGGMSPRHPFVALLQWAENFGYQHADCVASMLPRAQQHMQAHGMSAEKFAYLPNGVHVAEWHSSQTPIPQEHREVLARLKRENRFIVGYAGAHGLANALGTLLDAAQLLESEPVAFVLVGQGPEKEELIQRARQLRLENMVFLPPVPKLAIPALLASVDALFIGLKRTPIFRFGISPNKLMDYMMAGRPVIQAIEAGNDLVAESGCGLSIPPEDPSSVAEAVLHLVRLSPREREAMGLRGKEYVLANHDYQVLARRFLALLQ